MRIGWLLLWPKDTQKHPRRLKFRKGKINVITGWSRTGKIIDYGNHDYCLGSSKCAIPVGFPIRDTVEWFSLIIALNGKIVRISRRNPGNTAASPEFEVLHNRLAFSQARPESNSTLDSFKQYMDGEAGLTNVGVVPKTTDGGGVGSVVSRYGRLQFLAPAHSCHPYVLFFKADTSEHREKLRAVLPLVLGAIDNDYLIAKQRLADLEKEGKQLAAEVDTRKKAIEAWQSEAFTMYSRGVELGLFAADSRPETLDACLQLLRSLPNQADARIAEIRLGGSSAAISALDDARNREQEFDRNVTELKRRLRGLRRLQNSVKGYGETIQHYGERVYGTSWFKRKVNSDAACPVCGSNSDIAMRAMREMAQPIDELQRLTATTGSGSQMLDQEELEIEASLRAEEGLLFRKRHERLELEEALTQEERPAGTLEETFRFIGRVEQSLKNVDSVSGDDGLNTRLRNLREEYLATKANIDEKQRRAAEEAAHRAVSRLISQYAEFLSAEGSSDNPEIDPRELNIRFTRLRGEEARFLMGDRKRRELDGLPPCNSFGASRVHAKGKK